MASLAHQHIQRNGLRDLPFIDPRGLAAGDLDNLHQRGVLVVQLGAEAARAEGGGFVAHLFQLGRDSGTIDRARPFNRLGPEVDQHIAGIGILAGRAAAGLGLIGLVESLDLGAILAFKEIKP